MTVYADLLVLVNLITDWFLLRLTGRLIREDGDFLRIFLASLAGGISSLTVFLPVIPPFLEVLLRGGICAVLVLIAFGFRSLRRFLRGCAVLLGVTFGYAGLMFAVWTVFRPSGMVIRNSVVYFPISPLVLILGTAVTYPVILLIRRLVSRQAPTAERCEISLSAEGRITTFTAIADTGNSLSDPLSGGEVIVADPCVFEALLGAEQPDRLKLRYRVLPCTTVSGTDLLDGYRLDSASVQYGDKTVTLSHPILAVSKAPIRGDYSAVIDPMILER